MKPAKERAKSVAKSKARRETARAKVSKAPSSAAGDTAVAAYLAALPAAQRPIATRFDALVGRVVPGIRRNIKWGLPFYGVPGRGWIVSCGGFPT